jgi:hypothetical protein
MNNAEAFTAVIGNPEFTHREALDILGVTQDTLMSWFKRDLVPLPKHDNPGRGHRRKYSARDLLTLQLMRVVLPFVGQAEAGVAARDAAQILLDYWLRSHGGEFAATFIVLGRRERGYSVDLVDASELGQFFADTSIAESDREGLLTWLQDQPDANAERTAQAMGSLGRRVLVNPEARIVVDARATLVGLLSRIYTTKQADESKPLVPLA